MGIMDVIKSQATKLIDQHGDKVAKGMTKAGDAVATKANKNKPHEGGQHHEGDQRHEGGQQYGQ